MKPKSNQNTIMYTIDTLTEKLSLNKIEVMKSKWVTKLCLITSRTEAPTLKDIRERDSVPQTMYNHSTAKPITKNNCTKLLEYPNDCTKYTIFTHQ